MPDIPRQVPVPPQAVIAAVLAIGSSPRVAGEGGSLRRDQKLLARLFGERIAAKAPKIILTPAAHASRAVPFPGSAVVGVDTEAVRERRLKC
jgi:hypothetical protein